MIYMYEKFKELTIKSQKSVYRQKRFLLTISVGHVDKLTASQTVMHVQRLSLFSHVAHIINNCLLCRYIKAV